MADTKTKGQAATEPTPENEVIEATRVWFKTLRETGAAVVDTTLALQDRNVRFTQSVVDQSLQQMEAQAATLRKLYGDLASHTGLPTGVPSAAFRDFSREATEAYVGFLTAPARFARQAVKSVQDMVERGASEE